MLVKRVGVFCASSSQVDSGYCEAAYDLGKLLAINDIEIVYGGGAAGPMGSLAEGALAKGGSVIGVIPKFMLDLEWGHTGLTELKVVPTMHERKELMLKGADAAVALPGGSGTLEELIEAITKKRLGFFLKPIVIVNMNDFFEPFIRQIDRCIDERFMAHKHRDMISVVSSPAEVISAIENAPPWSPNARAFAAL
jgi:uncharacterized protein (TIGR00730 family)